MSRILVEGRNLILKRGTGIATYGRNLGAALRAAGFITDSLFNADFGLRRKRPQWNEIYFYDVERRAAFQPHPLLQSFGRASRTVNDLIGPSRAVEIADTTLMTDRTLFWSLEGFTRRFGVPYLFDRSDFSHRMIGRALTVDMGDYKADAFHLTHPAPVRVRGMPLIVTVHDIVPLRMPQATLDHKRRFYKVMKFVLKRADHITTVSETTKRDLVEFMGADEKRISVTYQPLNLPPKLLSRTDEDTAKDIEFLRLQSKDYFLFVGAVEPKKNVRRLIDAYLMSGTKKKLVIAGPPGWSSSEEFEWINSSAIEKYVVGQGEINKDRPILYISYVPFYLLMSLLRHVKALLFPSLYEGFGLPLLEAMTLGTPVMTSNRSCLPEVGGDAADYVDPIDVPAMSRAIRRLDQDGDYRAELIRRGKLRAQDFSFDRYVKDITAMYASLGIAPKAQIASETTRPARPL